MRGLRKTWPMKKGLTPRKQTPKNSEYLSIAKNVRVGMLGLELLPEINQVPGVSFTFPWPHLMNLQKLVCLGYASSVSVVDASWVLTQIISGAPSGDLWEVADFGLYLIFCNGESLYENDVDTGVYSQVASATFPSVRTLCSFKGQIVGGNVYSSWHDCDEHYAVWSDIGSKSFTADWQNIAGYRDMEIGEIYKCLPAGDDGILFYGSEGVARLIPAGTTYAYKKLSDINCLRRDAVSGMEAHVCLDAQGRLYAVTLDGVTELDYQPHLSALDLDATIITQDPRLGDFYISDGDRCFILANGELTESTQIPSGLIRLDGDLYGMYAGDARETIKVQYALLDMLLPAQKNLEFIEWGLTTDGVAKHSIISHYTKGNKQVTLGPNSLNDSNIGYFGVSGNAFEISISVTSVTELQLDYMTTGYKLTDNRVQNQAQTVYDGSWR